MTGQVDLFTGAGGLLYVPSDSLPERVIPFGKYKNQPYEVLLGDASYSLWLLGSMFAKLQEQHPALLAFLVNRFGLPDRTPDHNRLQNRFLAPDFAVRFAAAVSPRLQHFAAQQLTEINLEATWTRYVREALAKEKERADRMRKYEKGDSLVKLHNKLLECAKRLVFAVSTGTYANGVWHNAVEISCLQFESDGADVTYLVECHAALQTGWVTTPEEDSFGFGDVGRYSEKQEVIASFGVRDGFRIEVKPVVGDDYPAILRAMKAVKDSHLLVGEYTGAGATWAEVVRVFSLSGIVALQLADIEQTPMPAALESATILVPLAEQAQEIVRAEYAVLTV